MTIIRELRSETEIRLVAERMRETLVEVLGRERGESLYALEWLEDRVRWHLNPAETKGKVSVADIDSRVVGHAIARVEIGVGYFSTIYVEPASRRQGVATALMGRVEEWFVHEGLAKIIYNTATDNMKLIELFVRHGYARTLEVDEMVQLTKIL